MPTTKTTEPTADTTETPDESPTFAELDSELDEEETLRGVPALLPPEQFRQKQRSAITSITLQLADLRDDEGNLTDLSKFLTLLGEADEFFESIAADKKAYVQWATGLTNSEAVFSALIARYVRAVGE